jgi:heptosyltransferase III
VDPPVVQDRREGHHAEDTFRILEAFGIGGPPPAPRLAHDIRPPARGVITIGLHVSARRPRNRWREEAFTELARRLTTRFDSRLRLLWAPGAEDDTRHPGDDAKAARIAQALAQLPLQATPTHTLKGLIDALAACDILVCSDGGAMHLAAALGKPIVCFFGDSPASEWHPLGAPYRLLQPPSLEAADVTVDEALAAFESLAAEAGLLRRPARPPLAVARPT